MNEQAFIIFYITTLMGIVMWFIKFYVDRVIKGSNFETERITRKEAYTMLEKVVAETNQKIDELYDKIQNLEKEIVNIKLVLTKIETCLERNGKLGIK